MKHDRDRNLGCASVHATRGLKCERPRDHSADYHQARSFLAGEAVVVRWGSAYSSEPGLDAGCADAWVAT